MHGYQLVNLADVCALWRFVCSSRVPFVGRQRSRVTVWYQAWPSAHPLLPHLPFPPKFPCASLTLLCPFILWHICYLDTELECLPLLRLQFQRYHWNRRVLYFTQSPKPLQSDIFYSCVSCLVHSPKTQLERVPTTESSQYLQNNRPTSANFGQP
jgi:hypothetical protein